MIPSKALKAIIIGILFFVFILVRVFENELFYDPFIKFYKHILLVKSIPSFKFPKILMYTFFRYFINTAVSICILYVAFKKKEIIQFSVVFYATAFIILIGFYTILVKNLSEDTIQLFFYLRRFLIQPIFLLLLLPAFYYQQFMNHK